MARIVEIQQLSVFADNLHVPYHYFEISLILVERNTCDNILFVATLTQLVSARQTRWASRPKSQTNLPSRKVSDGSLGRDETSCVRIATNNVLSQLSILLSKGLRR